jgi:hypothetical protein
MPIDPLRLYAAERVAGYYGLSLEDAQSLLDSSDYLAMREAEAAVAEDAAISKDYN